MKKINKIHLIGIGGAGVGALAEIIIKMGYKVSGSDQQESEMTSKLKKLGADVFIGHNEKNIDNVDLIVTSTAISSENTEIKAAKSQGIKIISRASLLAQLMQERYGIAVSGTHGKTTTTGLISSIFCKAALNPTYMVGGEVLEDGVNGKYGDGKYLIAEADESDASFLLLKPTVTIITNIDVDHMGTYENDLEILKQSFVDFINSVPFYGYAILCIDCPVVREILPRLYCQYITYGFSEDADYKVCDYKQVLTSTNFSYLTPDKELKNETTSLPNKHNVLNSLAAIALSHRENLNHTAISNGLRSFKGVGRRFEIINKYNFLNTSLVFVDDYGHHPQEILATLASAADAWPENKVILTYQPHKYTRTRDLYSEFVNSLSLADEIIMVKEYPAGEKLILGADSKSLQTSIADKKNKEVYYADSPEAVFEFIKRIIEEQHAKSNMKNIGFTFIHQGAGDIVKYIEVLDKKLSEYSKELISENYIYA